jgi:lysozyme family protein
MTMITSYDDCFARLMENEGGYSFRSNGADPGGETMYGITMTVARKWGYNGAMQDLPLETAKAIARKWYWEPYRCDQLPPAVAFHVFDSAYHGGAPVRWLQEAVGSTPDGIIGPKTVAAVRAAEPAAVVMAFNRRRLEYLTGLKNWPQNARGWTRRIVRNMEVF